jgi:peroxiredoxin
MKKILLAAICWLPLSLMAQKAFTLRGKIGELGAPAMAHLRYFKDSTEVKDSVLLKNGEFTFKGQLSGPVQAELTLRPEGKIATGEDMLTFYLENSDISVTAAKYAYGATVKGSAVNDDDKMLQAIRGPYRKVADSVTKVYYGWTPEQKKDNAMIKDLRAIMRSTELRYNNANRAFIANHLNSYISLLVFKDLELAYDFNPDSAALKFARFPESLKTSRMGKRLAAVIELSRKTNTGVMAMDFTEPDTAGRPVKLSDFRGKYVLVDFWASWCKPCRAENPNMVKAYNKYKNNDFTVLGVSIDDPDGRNAWLAAVHKDGLPWTQVSELKGAKAKSAVLYGVTSVPANFLIDPSGKIIARNLRGEDLEKKLASLFSSK